MAQKYISQELEFKLERLTEAVQKKSIVEPSEQEVFLNVLELGIRELERKVFDGGLSTGEKVPVLHSGTSENKSKSKS